MPIAAKQLTLFSDSDECQPARNESTFVDNMRLPVHRWFRYSAGFSAAWAEQVIAKKASVDSVARVLDPFAGSATTLLAAKDVGVESIGVEAHPFINRVARAKLARTSDPYAFRDFARAVLTEAHQQHANIDAYPKLVRKCYRDDALVDLDKLRRALDQRSDGSLAADLTWLALVGILRSTSHVGTANWQYILPRKLKKVVADPFTVFAERIDIIHKDMLRTSREAAAPATLIETDARTCEGVSDRSVNLVITSPPYPNNYDYADATRLEMSFLREIEGWGDLQHAVRQYLVRSCSQHVPEKSIDLASTLAEPELAPIRDDLATVCHELAEIRLKKGGKKTYHLMVACYFLDLAQVWQALRRVCETPSQVCFVVGDSAPYGVYVPVSDWLGRLALAADFHDFRFEKTRDRNLKWKNRKHRVPLCEGRLWVTG